MPLADRTCQVSSNWDRRPPYCGKPAVVVMLSGCAHEHISEEAFAMCQECWNYVEGMTWYCVPCMETADAKDSHYCLTIRKIIEKAPGAEPVPTRMIPHWGTFTGGGYVQTPERRRTTADNEYPEISLPPR